MLDFQNLFLHFFQWASDVLKQPTPNAYQSYFYWVAASLATEWLLILTCYSLIALDEVGWWLVWVFHHVSTGRFLPAPWDCGKETLIANVTTPRATPATVRTRGEQPFQSIVNKNIHG
jgi:hypothetical protein